MRHEPLLDQYTMLTIFGTRVQERRYATLDALTAALAFAYQINVSPARPGNYYYAATLEVSTLSDSDLDELERFLEGDLGGVRGDRPGWAMLWDGERRDSCCGWRGCRACGWKRGPGASG